MLFLLLSMSMIQAVPLIDTITVDRNELIVVVNHHFKKQYLKSDFFVRYHDDIVLADLDESLLIVPFLLNVITIIWASGHVYTIPALDYELWRSLEVVKNVFKNLYPHTKWNGAVVPERLVSHDFTFNASGVAHMFSNGLDSICSSLVHRDESQLLITVQGHADTPLNNDGVWATIRAEACNFAQRYGFSNAFLSSNYYDILKRRALHHLSPEISHWRTAAVEGLGWIGLTIPLLICKGYNHLRIASSISWECPFAHAANPFIDNAIRCAGVRVEHDGFEYSRVQKCNVLKKCLEKSNEPRPRIRVCVESKNATNCCVCIKCLQTIHCLWAVGLDHKDYGFECDDQVIITALRAQLQKRFSRFKLWHFECIQAFLTEKQENGDALSDYLTWFLHYDFSQHVKKERKQHPRIDWRAFSNMIYE